MNILIGFLSGIAASMGFGGGFILIIYLTVFAGADQLTAQGINLLFFLPTALLSLIIHWKNRLIEWKLLPLLILTGVGGALLGSWISSNIEVGLLRKLFASLLIFVGIKEIFHRKNPKTIDKRPGNKYNEDNKCDDREKSS